MIRFTLEGMTERPDVRLWGIVEQMPFVFLYERATRSWRFAGGDDPDGVLRGCRVGFYLGGRIKDRVVRDEWPIIEQCVASAICAVQLQRYVAYLEKVSGRPIDPLIMGLWHNRDVPTLPEAVEGVHRACEHYRRAVV